MAKVNPRSDVYRKFAFCEVYSKYLPRINTQEDLEFIYNKTKTFPLDLMSTLLFRAFKENSYVERNRYITRHSRIITELFPQGLRNFSLHSESGIDSIAKWANRQANLHVNIFAPVRIETLTLEAHPLRVESESKHKSNRVDFPNKSVRSGSLQSAYNSLKKLCEHLGVSPPKLHPKKVTLEGAIKRLTDESWWKSKIRSLVNQTYDQAFRILGCVQKHGQIYLSDRSFNARQQQIFKNLQLMEQIAVTNNLGQTFTLAELSSKNGSNPAVRKAELMVRARGFEEYANEMGHTGLFITMTCPSMYHAAYAKSGQLNSKYKGLTPYDGQQYLNRTFARIRAKLARLGITYYGLRVVEPQHDGTPHWHLLLFVQESDVNSLKSCFQHYSLEECGDEKGAKENRVDFKVIDKDKGSATGYIAKYISKNIDGEGLDKGVYGEDPKCAAKRVEAWASTWKIRQFQQIGGASVTVWRALRRLKQSNSPNPFFESVRVAADSSNWCEFNKLLNAINQNKKDHAIKPYYDYSVDLETGELSFSHYDRTLTEKLKGVVFREQKIISRPLSWVTKFIPQF